jgi:hypothetical protein
MNTSSDIPIPKVSGFTICRNSQKLGYPYIESLLSLAPLCDEIIVTLDDTEDGTKEQLLQLQTQFKQQLKVELKIINTQWNMQNMKGGSELAVQTDIALSHCQHNIVFYLQSDEVLHEEDYPLIKQDLLKLAQHPKAQSLVFQWIHFYGDQHTIVQNRKWYRKEIRAFKKSSGLKSFKDAQSFRKPFGENTLKLPALESKAKVLHYGHMRPSQLMAEKINYFREQWQDRNQSKITADTVFKPQYGIQKFKGTHPLVMQKHLTLQSTNHTPAFEILCPKILDAKNIRFFLSDIIERSTGYRVGEFKSYSKLFKIKNFS